MTAVWIFLASAWVGIGYQFVAKWRSERARMDWRLADFEARHPRSDEVQS